MSEQGSQQVQVAEAEPQVASEPPKWGQTPTPERIRELEDRLAYWEQLPIDERGDPAKGEGRSAFDRFEPHKWTGGPTDADVFYLAARTLADSMESDALAAYAAWWERGLRRVPPDERVTRERACPFPIHDPNPIHQRLEAVFAEVRRSEGQALLYVEHLQRLVGGEQEPYPVDMHDLLKPALGMAELRILGACSVDAYCEYLEKGAAMQRRFAEACLPSLPQYPGRNGDIES